MVVMKYSVATKAIFSYNVFDVSGGGRTFHGTDLVTEGKGTKDVLYDL